MSNTACYTVCNLAVFMDFGGVRERAHLPQNVRLCKLPRRRIAVTGDLAVLSRRLTPQQVLGTEDFIGICGTSFVVPRHMARGGDGKFFAEKSLRR